MSSLQKAIHDMSQDGERKNRVRTEIPVSSGRERGFLGETSVYSMFEKTSGGLVVLPVAFGKSVAL